MEKKLKPDGYNYYKLLVDKFGGDESIFFDNNFYYPRQLEIHLPANHIRSCNLSCNHCSGKLLSKTLGTWESDVLSLIYKLEGKVPYHIFGGAYTEPLMNPYIMAFIGANKKYNNHFGIHTNGTMLYDLDKNQGFLLELNRLSTDPIDYISISLDAGNRKSWAKSKKSDEYLYDRILLSIDKACSIRRGTNSHSIRVNYLITEETENEQEIKDLINFCKKVKVDSLRLTVPYTHYSLKFSKLEKYKQEIEIPHNEKYSKLVAPYLSKERNEKPFVFYVDPNTTSVNQYYFDKCIYGYYQVTFGADGYMYKCSASATPTAKQCRLGKIVYTIDDLKKVIIENYSETWSAKKRCFDAGMRCNRMGIEINQAYYNRDNI